jgi:hypothetical protein
MNFESGLTRRSLLRAGAGAGAAAVIGVRPWAAASAAAAGAPGYLTRSGYAGLEGTTFTVETGADPVVLRLESVADVAGAATRRALAGSDDSFALTFSGPLGSPLDSGIHTLRHPRLGSFELFASPVDEPEGSRTYEVVVDRSVPGGSAVREAPAAPARPKDAGAGSPAGEDDPAAGGAAPGAAAPGDPPRTALLRRASLRRAGRWLRCELVLARSEDAERVRVRLMRNGHVLARARAEVADGRAAVRLENDRPLTAARYTLVVTAVHADGSHTVERRRVTVR